MVKTDAIPAGTFYLHEWAKKLDMLKDEMVNKLSAADQALEYCWRTAENERQVAQNEIEDLQSQVIQLAKDLQVLLSNQTS